MTAVVLAAAVLVAVVVGVLAGEAWFRLRRSREYRRGVLAGQWQSDLTHTVHEPDTDPRLFNGPPRPRRRVSDRKQEKQPEPLPRPVFHD
ncbi:hypothetical protein [Actinoplanes rectilineatus]|uniref:hypothetical protein n=1 Tax=Actinoplanes rectilineatus TaxID=113571 RepID=UPI0005F28830|nr:hypothetical protein [Actinoplanes rectilineatus]